MAPARDQDLLTIGEAADRAGVALIELRDHIRAGRLVTFRGWRNGVELPLLALADLEELYPGEVRSDPNRLSLAARGISVIDAAGPPIPLRPATAAAGARPPARLRARSPVQTQRSWRSCAPGSTRSASATAS